MKAILLGTILAATATVTSAHAQDHGITLTPKVGYAASTDGESGRNKRDNVAYGAGLSTKITENTALELEYLRSGDARKYDTTSLNAYYNLPYGVLGSNNYVMAGAGHVHDNSSSVGTQIAGQFVVGHRFAATSPMPIKTEIRSVHYLDNDSNMKQRSHEMQALIGAEFKF